MNDGAMVESLTSLDRYTPVFDEERVPINLNCPQTEETAILHTQGRIPRGLYLQLN